MARLNWFERTSGGTVTIADYTATETIVVMPVGVGELIGYGLARVTTVFDGSGTAAVLIIGDDGDTNRFFEDGDINEEATGLYRGLGVGMDNAHLYTAANTIDVVFTRDTGADGTTGFFNFWFYIARIDPH